MKTAHIRYIVRLAALLGIALGTCPVATAQASTFVQAQRVNSLTLEFGTDAFAPNNAIGGAIVGSQAQQHLQQALTAAVTQGSISWVLDFSNLTDLSGTDNSSFNVGVMDGVAEMPSGNLATYDGTSDLDWWYLGAAGDVNTNGSAIRTLPATFAGGTFNAGPGDVSLGTFFGGSTTALDMSSTRLQAISGASSAPTTSSNGYPPGHLPAESLDPGLTSFASMSSGKLAGNASAQSLENTLVPSGLTGSNCNNLYTPQNTLLDVLVSGCTVTISGFSFSEIQATQPDQVAPGATGTYTFSADPNNHDVNACKHNGVSDTLPDCLAHAAYSIYLQFTTDRVILRKPCAPGSYSATGDDPCTAADPGYYVSGYGATTETQCPAGMTSVSAGSSSCSFIITTTSAGCGSTSLVIGVAAACTATVTNQAAGPAATGMVSWSGPSGGGHFSAGSCALAPSGGDGVCSVHYKPAPGSAGHQQLGATYGGDGQHASSGNQPTVTVIRRSSSIRVSCQPKTIVKGQKTVCTATVADISPGTVIAPKGEVKWSAPIRDGSFGSATCTLALHKRARSCSDTFTLETNDRGPFTLTAAYVGDPSHSGTTAHFPLG